MRTGASTLILVGLLGIAFFLGTDPRFGLRVTGGNAIDAAHNLWPGTVAGVVFCALFVISGLWLATRRIR